MNSCIDLTADELDACCIALDLVRPAALAQGSTPPSAEVLEQAVRIGNSSLVSRGLGLRTPQRIELDSDLVSMIEIAVRAGSLASITETGARPALTWVFLDGDGVCVVSRLTSGDLRFRSFSLEDVPVLLSRLTDLGQPVVGDHVSSFVVRTSQLRQGVELARSCTRWMVRQDGSAVMFETGEDRALRARSVTRSELLARIWAGLVDPVLVEPT